MFIMEKNEDMRVRRTHKLLVEAMFSLLEKKRFDDISVRELCDQAMVHKATFYKHFEDKYHFFEFCIETELEKLVPSLEGDINSLNRKEYFMSIINKVLDFLDANRKMVKLTIEATNSNTLTDAIHKAISAEIYGKLTESERAGISYRVPVKMLGEYYAGALIALAKWWIMSSTKISKEEVAGYVDILVEDSIYSKTV